MARKLFTGQHNNSKQHHINNNYHTLKFSEMLLTISVSHTLSNSHAPNGATQPHSEHYVHMPTEHRHVTIVKLLAEEWRVN